jgi:hypothetical protein
MDRRDATIQALTRDLDESEEQYQTAQRSHLDKLQSTHSPLSSPPLPSPPLLFHSPFACAALSVLININNSKIARLETEFERDLKALKAEFLEERY